MSILSKKICLIGDFGVGKTSLVRRFVERQFSDQYLSTVGVKISRKTLELPIKSETLNIQLLLWDLAGSSKFKSITPTYLQGASGAIVVADINREETITQIQEHIKLFSSINPKSLLIVAINKSDLAPPEKLTQISNNYHFKDHEKVLATYFTSAKNGLYVDEIFQKLAYSII